MAIIDLTEKPLQMRAMSATLARAYHDIQEKCCGRCSQYVGSSVGLSPSRGFRSVASRLSKEILSKVKFEDVFIPSFGAPHTFIHAGYEK